MTCEACDRVLAASPSDAAALDHRLTCPGCRRLEAAFEAASVLPEAGPSPAVLEAVTKEIRADLKPVRPLAPAGVFAAAMAAILLLLVAYGTRRLGAFAISVMSAVQMWSVFLSLAASAALLAYSLVRQMTPGSRQPMPPSMIPVGVVVLLLLVMAAVFQTQTEPNFLRSGLRCLSAGVPFALIAAVAFFFILRRGAMLSPRVTGAVAGCLAGLVGTTVLEIHCPNLDLSHILMWHLGVAVMGTLAGLGAGLMGEWLGRKRP